MHLDDKGQGRGPVTVDWVWLQIRNKHRDFSVDQTFNLKL